MHVRWRPEYETAWYFAAERAYMDQLDDHAHAIEAIRMRQQAQRARAGSSPTPATRPPLGRAQRPMHRGRA